MCTVSSSPTSAAAATTAPGEVSGEPVARASLVATSPTPSAESAAPAEAAADTGAPAPGDPHPLPLAVAPAAVAAPAAGLVAPVAEAAAAPRFAQGQCVWYKSTPKTWHDAVVLDDCDAEAATVRIRFNTSRFVEEAAVELVAAIDDGAPSRRRSRAAAATPTEEKAAKKSRSGARKPKDETTKKSRSGARKPKDEKTKKSRSGARARARAAKPPAPASTPERRSGRFAASPAPATAPAPAASGEEEWQTEGSPWIGTRLMRTVFDFDAEAAANKPDIAWEPTALASKEGRSGARKVAVDQCACEVVGWLPAAVSDFVDDDGFPAALFRVRYLDGDLAGDSEDLEEHELLECQGQAREIDEVPEVCDAAAVLEALRTVDVTVLSHDLRRNVRLHETQEVRSIPIGAIGRGTGGTGVRLSEETRDRPRLARLLARFGDAVLPPGFKFTSIQVNANYRSAMHCDGANVGASAIVALGDFTGGNLWTHDRGLVRVDGPRRGRPQFFNGNMPHMTMPFQGERYSLIYFCCGNWGSLPAHEEAELASMGFRFPARPASPHCGPSKALDDRAYRREAFPTPRKAYEYEYGFQVHEDHIIEAALTNYATWCDRFAVDDVAAARGDAEAEARLARAAALQRRGPGADVSDACPGLVLGANARLAWDCFTGDSPRNMAKATVPWRHLKHPLGGTVLYCERCPRSQAVLFGVFYDDGDFEELTLDLLAERLPPHKYVVYVGEKQSHRAIASFPPPSVARLRDIVDAPKLARLGLARADGPIPDGAADRQRAGKVRLPGGESNPRRISRVVGGHHMAAAGLLPPAPAPVPDKWQAVE